MNATVQQLAKEKHKERSPEETVEKIQAVLDRMGITCTEEWADPNEIGTFSVRLNVKGTSIGSNGKGMTKAFARASAYAEFLERIQNNKLMANSTLNNILCDKKNEFFLYPDERLLSFEEIVEENNSFMELFFATSGTGDEQSDAEKIDLLAQYQKLDYNLHRKRCRYLSLPYYSMRDQKTVYLPFTLENTFYGSNGMCAGNTREEAIVQGISEIIERYVQTQMVMGQISLPDVPESYIARFPDVYEMYQKIRANKNYLIFLKDGSMGGVYPACVLIVVEKNTGWYGIKVGSHPDYRIAMERLFTEATQGISLEMFAHKAQFDFSNLQVSNRRNLQNGFKTGDAKYPYQLFAEQAMFPFAEPKDFTGASNREMLDHLVEILAEDGRDILIHDVSYLDFPAYHIIVPGVSEMNIPSKNDFEAENTRFHVQPLVNHPEWITKETVKYIISAIGYYQHNIQSNTLKDFSGKCVAQRYPGNELGLDLFYFKAMCYMFLRDYEKAAETFDLLLEIAQSISHWVKTDVVYFAISQYLHGMCVLRNHDTVLQFLRRLYDADCCDRIHQIFAEPATVLTRQYFSLDDGMDAPLTLQAQSRISNSTEYLELIRLHERYNEMQALRQPIDQCKNLQDVFAVSAACRKVRPATGGQQ